MLKRPVSSKICMQVKKSMPNSSYKPQFLCFCLRRSPDHGTVDVVVVVVLLLLLVGGTTLVFYFFQDTEIFIK